MAKTITFTIDGKEYILEFTRKTVIDLERKGFTPFKAQEHPIEMNELLFYGAFLAHHPNIKKEQTDEIITKLGNTSELWDKLVNMYMEPVEAFFENGQDKDDEGKVKWEATF